MWVQFKLCEVPIKFHDDFAVAFLKNSNTVGHVTQEISRISAGSYDLHCQWSFHVSTSSGGNKNTWTDSVLFAKLKAKATRLTKDSMTADWLLLC